MTNARILVIVFGLLLGGHVHAQLIPGSAAEELDTPREGLRMREQWWVGGSLAGGLHQAFGTLDLTYITSPVPELPSAHARTEGGWGASMMIAPTIEYRPYRSSFGVICIVGVDYQRVQSISTQPVSQQPYSYNATFTTTVSRFSVVASAMATWYVGTRGVMIMAGPTLDIPVSASASVWQQEELADTMTVGDEPGFPQTSIQYRPVITTETRVGFQLGCAINIMAGLFGYTGQLVTPYVMLHAATPITRDPTDWNAAALRVGVMWRAGL